MEWYRGRWPLLIGLVVLALAIFVAACSDDDGEDQSSDQEQALSETGGRITIYSGRAEELVGGLFARFEEETGIDVRIRYGGTAELAAQILEESDRSPADIFFAQDAGALGAVAESGRFEALPADLLDRVAEAFRASDGTWVGISGRARVLVYSSERLAEADLPDSVFDLTDPEWKGRVGWAPTNGSFQAFVTAMRLIDGEERTAKWLRDMLANDVREYSNNSTQVQAVADGEIDLGLVNHYYLWRFKAEDPNIPAANLYTDSGGAGALINVAGIGLLDSALNRANALRFIDYLLSPAAQEYFASPQADDGFEYPLIDGVPLPPGVPALDTLDPPSLQLTSLADLEGTLDLVREAGVLP